MSKKFYYRQGDQTHGPVGVEQLRRMANDGTLTKADLIRPLDKEKWYVAGAVKGLFSDASTISAPSKDRSPVSAVATVAPRPLTTTEGLAGEVRRTRSPEQGHAPGLPAVNVLLPRRGSSLGIASLVLGILAFLFCWIPLLGAFTLPLSGLGAILGAVGIVIALTRKGAGIGFPIAGTAVSVLALVIAFTMTSALVSGMAAVGVAMNEADAQRNATNQELIDEKTAPQETEAEGVEDTRQHRARTPAAPPEPEWALAETPVKQGDVQIQIVSANVDYVSVNDPTSMSDGPGRSNNPQLVITVELVNLSVTKKLDYRTWAGARVSFDRDYGTLQDNFGNNYKRVGYGFMSAPVGRTKSSSMFPNKTISDVLIFEAPIDAAEHLDLELPAKNFGGTGMIRIRIPITMVKR